MDIDIWASHADDFSIEVNSFTEEPKDVWYTVVLGERPSRVKFYITHEQLKELTGKCVTAMVDAKPEDDFYREESEVAASITKALEETELCREGEHACEPDWDAERGYHYVCGESLCGSGPMIPQLSVVHALAALPVLETPAEDDFYRGPIEATYEPTELGKAAL